MKYSLAFLLPPLFLLLTSALGIVFGKNYAYNIIGQLLCKGKPWANIKIQLWDFDCLFSGIGDDHMATTTTDTDGHFQMHGEEDEGNRIPSPYVYIDDLNYNNCVSNFPLHKIG
jgi:hypothetical protein